MVSKSTTSSIRLSPFRSIRNSQRGVSVDLEKRRGENPAYQRRARLRAQVVCVAIVVALVAGLVGFVVPAPAAAQQPGNRYIVVLRDDVANPGVVASELARRHGLGVSHVYTNVLKGFAATVPDPALDGLRRNPNVSFIDPDFTVTIAQDAQAMRTLSSGAMLPTGVDRAGAEAAGAGTAVAVLDTGIASHADLNIAGGRNCTSSDTSAWGDVNGHGTHVAGTVGAKGKIVGVAPGTPLWAVKVLGDNGSGYWSWIICGIDWAAAQGITVGNMSLSGASSEVASSCGSSSLHLAICNAQGKGLRFAVAAGNSSADASGYVPAKYAEVITVSALADSNGCDGGIIGTSTSAGADESRASFSNYGSAVKVAAPGVDIYSTVPGGYGTKSGTSMAAPHVAGLMALGGYTTTPSRWGGESVAILGGGDTGCGTTTGDTQAPSAPTNLQATADSATQVSLSWTASTDNVGVTGYEITRNNTVVATVTGTTYTDSTVTTSTSYSYIVKSKDAAGNVSAASNTATVTTPASVTVPLAPSNVTATKSGSSMAVKWTDRATNETGYKVYRNDLLIATLGANASGYKDTKVTRGVTYTYCVAAYNGAGEGKTCTGTGAGASEATSDAETPADGFTAGNTVVVTAEGVSLRAEPSRQAIVVEVLSFGTPLTVTGPAEERQGLSWYPVETANGMVGYVAAEFLAMNDSDTVANQTDPVAAEPVTETVSEVETVQPEVTAAPVPAAAATLMDEAGNTAGAATFETGADGAVVITVYAFGFEPGAHGIHLHGVGYCDPWAGGGAFASAGAHVDMAGRPHGSHAGDLGNLVADTLGLARYQAVTAQVTLAQLLDADGAALVIHAGPDDGFSEPDGGSGARVACGALVQVDPAGVGQLHAAGEAALIEAAARAAAPVDTDGDGLTDADEAAYGTDPTSADTDADGLNDAGELFTYGTNPLVYDTDGDSLGDGEEVATGSDPLTASVPTEAGAPTLPVTDEDVNRG